VLALVVGECLRLAGVGLVIGVAVALLATRALASLLYGVTPSDPVAFAAVVALLLGVALAASYLPARRATAVDPMSVLRNG
jgi:ABC-type antimicrobial peptide transport system permease subunit